jgi:hypothetical protein
VQITPQLWMYGKHLDEETTTTREALLLAPQTAMHPVC